MTETNTKPLTIQVGDFLAAPNTVWLRVAAVLDQGVALYGLVTLADHTHMHWYTAAEIRSKKLRRGSPQFDLFTSLQIGDIVQTGDADGPYVKVLARVGDAVLLSEEPSQAADVVLDFGRMMNEKLGRDVMSDEQAEKLQAARSTNQAHQRAGDWYDVHTMALRNWNVVRES